MDKNKANVPKIRFPGFTDPWEQRKVKDIFKVTRGYVLAATETTDKKTDEMHYPVYSSQTKDNGLMGYYKDFLYENAITWTTDGANAGTVNYREGKFYCTNVCGVLLSDDGYANKMVSEALNNISWKHVSKVGNPKLMNNVMSEIVVSLPKTIEEQNIISDLLNRLDNLINLHQRKLNHLQDKKKSLLQKMFPEKGEDFPKIRFPGFIDPWEQRKLGELCDEFQSGKNIKSEDIRDEGRYPVFGGNGLRGYTNTYNHDGLYALIGRQGALCGNMNISYGKAYFTEHAVAVKGNKNNETRFLFYLLGVMNLGQYSGQSAQPGLAVNRLIELSAFIPTFVEQAQISALFKKIDNLIILNQRKLNHLKEQKKSLLQQMFV
jgi:type I restriction enzyme S subunit